MGFLTILRKIKQKEKEMRILILGLDNAGKTTLLKQLNGEDVNEISPTFGFNIKSFSYRGFILNLWDVGGQRSLRSYWKNYFESTDGVIWVLDSGDKYRLADCRIELHKLLLEERLMGASLLVLANKQDLPGSMRLHDIKNLLKLDEIRSHHWKLMKCSALTGQDVLVGINWIVEDIASRIFTME